MEYSTVSKSNRLMILQLSLMHLALLSIVLEYEQSRILVRCVVISNTDLRT